MKARTAPWRRALLEGWRPYAWLAGLAAALYARCLSFGIILLDDNVYVYDKFRLLSDWANLPLIFRSGSFLGAAKEFYYRPLLVASFMLDAHLGGQDVAVYHLSNVLFHAAAAALLFRTLAKIIGADRALLMSAVFACHPALTGAAAWINGRTDSLLAVLAFGSFTLWQDYLETGGIARLAGHLALLAGALLCKELAVVLPALCAAYAGLIARRAPRHGAAYAGWLAVLMGWWFLRAAFVHPDGTSTRVMASSAAANIPVALFYLGKAFWPAGLSPYPVFSRVAAFEGAGAAAALVWLSRRTPSRIAAFGALWFVATITPALVFLSQGSPLFGYRLYLPLAGLLLVLAETPLLKGFSVDDPGRAAPAAALVALLCAGSWLACAPYRDDLAAWSSAVEGSPGSAFAHMQLGTALLRRSDLSGAETQYSQAVALDPLQPMAHNNLGVVYMRTGRLAQAEEQYLTELKINPGYTSAAANLELIRTSTRP